MKKLEVKLLIKSLTMLKRQNIKWRVNKKHFIKKFKFRVGLKNYSVPKVPPPLSAHHKNQQSNLQKKVVKKTKLTTKKKNLIQPSANLKKLMKCNQHRTAPVIAGVGRVHYLIRKEKHVDGVMRRKPRSLGGNNLNPNLQLKNWVKNQKRFSCLELPARNHHSKKTPKPKQLKKMTRKMMKVLVFI